MIIGIGKEIKKDESRVGLTPKKVKILIENNHTVLVEKDAGILSSFSNEDYINVDARIVEKPELYSKAELIIKVKNLFPEEVNLLSENQIIFTYLPLDENATPQFSKNLTKTKVNIIAYEWVCDKGVYVLLKPMSELTGLQAQRSKAITKLSGESATAASQTVEGAGKVVGVTEGLREQSENLTNQVQQFKI